MDKSKIVDIIKNHRSTVAEKRTLRQNIEKLILASCNNDSPPQESLHDTLIELYAKYYEAYYEVEIVTTWLCLLHDDERFLITKHLIGGLTWPHVSYEYEAKWGKENGRSERTMKRTQAIAIEKIASHMVKFKDNDMPN